MLLDQPWPPDLHPNRVPFRRRTLTVMERAGLFDHPAAIDDLTEDAVLGWENAGVLTLQDFIAAGNAGIAFHHGPGRELVAVADEAWAEQVSRRDPRFADLLPGPTRRSPRSPWKATRIISGSSSPTWRRSGDGSTRSPLRNRRRRCGNGSG